MKNPLLLQIKNRSRNWFYHLNPMFRLSILAVFVGILGGIGSWLFLLFIQTIFQISILKPYEWIISQGWEQYAWLPFLIAPILGGLVVGYINMKVPPEMGGHGIPNVIEAINLNGGRMHPAVPIVKLVTASFTLGTGGSAGVEGPIAQIGAGFGSFLGQKLKLSLHEIRALVIAGVSAGISAIFNAPIGGILFAIEVVKRKSTINNFAPMIVASLSANVVSYFLLGEDPVFNSFPSLTYPGPAYIPFYILLGVICGVISALWIKFYTKMERGQVYIFNKMHIPSWIRPAIGAAFIGIISVLLYFYLGSNWPLYTIMGATHEPMNTIFKGAPLEYSYGSIILFFLVIIILKMVATSLTIGSGGSGGLFMPTLFIGVFLGALFGIIIAYFYNLPLMEVEFFSLLGMAAFFAGTIRAPFTAVILAAEITGNYFLMIPLTFGVIFSMLVSSKMEADDLYIKKIHEKGIVLGESFSDLMDQIQVKEVMTKFDQIIKVSPEMHPSDVMNLMRTTKHEGFPVMENDRMIGIITFTDLLKSGCDFSGIEKIGEIIKNKKQSGLICITAYTTMSQAQLIMTYFNISRLPVIEKHENRPPNLIGWLTKHDFEKTFRLKHEEFDPIEIRNHAVFYDVDNHEILDESGIEKFRKEFTKI